MALVLAGGRSSRMGEAKEWLSWQGRPLFLHVLDCLQRECESIWVVATQSQSLPEGPPSYRRINDPIEEKYGGPFLALRHALHELAKQKVETVYLSSSDAAGLSSDHIRFVLGTLDAKSCDAVLPLDPSGRGQPLASAFRLEPLMKYVEYLAGQGNRKLRAIFEEVNGGQSESSSGGAISVPVPRVFRVPWDQLPDPGAFCEINTPEQWEAWKRSRPERERLGK